MKNTKKLLGSVLISVMLLGGNAQAASGKEIAKAGGATVVGTAAGYGVAAASGLSACSIVGGGMGFGCSSRSDRRSSWCNSRACCVWGI